VSFLTSVHVPLRFCRCVGICVLVGKRKSGSVALHIRGSADMTQLITDDERTQLEWGTVDHWSTDNPYTHVVRRDKDNTSKDLIIPRDYSSEGMRRRLSELRAERLVPHTELEMQREVDQERWMGLDCSFQRAASRRRAGVYRTLLRAYPGDGRTRRHHPHLQSYMSCYLQRTARRYASSAPVLGANRSASCYKRLYCFREPSGAISPSTNIHRNVNCGMR